MIASAKQAAQQAQLAQGYLHSRNDGIPSLATHAAAAGSAGGSTHATPPSAHPTEVDRETPQTHAAAADGTSGSTPSLPPPPPPVPPPPSLPVPPLTGPPSLGAALHTPGRPTVGGMPPSTLLRRALPSITRKTAGGGCALFGGRSSTMFANTTHSRRHPSQARPLDTAGGDALPACHNTSTPGVAAASDGPDGRSAASGTTLAATSDASQVQRLDSFWTTHSSRQLRM